MSSADIEADEAAIDRDVEDGIDAVQARIHRIFLDGYGVLVFRIVIFKISSFKLLGYGVLAADVLLFLIFDQSIIYDVYTDVDTTHSSNSSNGLLICQSLGYII
ncbi:hypothetical protein Tco_0945139 [Tanacetum coccineum]